MSERPNDPDAAPVPDEPEPWRASAPADPLADVGAGDAAPGALWSVVRRALAEREWEHEQVTDGVALVRVQGLATNYDLALAAIEELSVVRCTVALHLYVAEPFRSAVCDLMNRIDHDELLLGGFQMDPETGRVRWRCAFDVEGAEPTPALVHNLINAGMWACNRFWPALLAVGVLGTSPEAALEIAREG